MNWLCRSVAGKLVRCHRRALAVFLLLLLTSGATSVAAQDDLKPFSVTDISGEFSVRYLLDHWSNDSPNAVTFIDNPTWYEELSLSASGYVYHPAFLNWTVGGGPLLIQYAYESKAGRNSGSETLFNFNTELNFLSMRAYPVTFYLRRDHPEIFSGESGRFLIETNEYGIKGRLTEPLSPVFISWDLGHWDSAGSGFGTTVDENQNRISFQAALPYRKQDNLRLNLDWSDRDSKSGAPGLPIQQSRIRIATAELDGDNTFGDAGQIILRHNLRWLSQETMLATTTDLDSLAYNGVFNWQHGKTTRSFANLQYVDVNRTESWSKSGNFRAGVIHDFTENLTVTGDGGYSREQAPAFAQDVSQAQAQGNYRRSLPFGSLGISVSAGMQRTDQVSDTDRVTIFDESILFAGSNPIALSRDFVVSGSTVVTNVPQTQIFVEDIDYRLVTIGSTTTIERIITGAIEDGQTVLVTYDVLTGGTIKYNTINQGLSLSLSLWKYANLFVNYSDSNNNIISGNSTIPLNDVNRIELGGSLSYPFFNGWTMGMDYRHTKQDEDISPNNQNSYNIYVQSGSYWRTSARFQLNRETVEYRYSSENVDLYRYILGLTSRLPGGLLLTYNGEYTEDKGGTLLRNEQRHSLRLDWSYRQVLFTLRAGVSEITQGDNNRNYRRITALLRRVF